MTRSGRRQSQTARAARQTRAVVYKKMGEMGMFSGMMLCADCGSVMYQCRATNFRREQEYYLARRLPKEP